MKQEIYATYKMQILGDDGQYQLWQIGSSFASVRFDVDTRAVLSINTDCDGWDQDGLGYRKAGKRQLKALAKNLGVNESVIM